MDEGGNLFLDEEKSHGENAISILLILVSVSLVVGIYYFFIGKGKPASANPLLEQSNFNEFISADKYFSFKYPATWSVIDVYENSTTSSQAIAPINSNNSTKIIINKVFTGETRGLNEILESVRYGDSNIKNITIISYSQKNKNDFVYETIYEKNNVKMRSMDEVIEFSGDVNSNIVYIISFESLASNWSDYYPISKSLFDSIIIK